MAYQATKINYEADSFIKFYLPRAEESADYRKAANDRAKVLIDEQVSRLYQVEEQRLKDEEVNPTVEELKTLRNLIRNAVTELNPLPCQDKTVDKVAAFLLPE